MTEDLSLSPDRSPPPADPDRDEVGDVVPLSSDTPVVAAGAICWRTGAAGVEVLLVHRPRYDDWSFPKGKAEPGELPPVCAVREVREETGLLVRLGRPLPEVWYTDALGRPKQVHYWSARVLDTVGSPNPAEVDRLGWFSLAAARARLTAPGDRDPLGRLAELAEAGTLDTSGLLVVRHGTARPRDAWARADAERPLIAAGQRQAVALADLLTAWRPDVAVSSPWRRCVDTLAPYAKRSNVRVRTKGGLSERGFLRSPEKVTRHVQHLLDRAGVSLVCTHRPVLSGVMEALAARASRSARAAIPDADPYLAPGEVLVAHVSHPRGGPVRVVEVERHPVPR
jgi:8-oxo-dGTP diphosphatase